jgi:lysophospholipase L1-like esterase
MKNKITAYSSTMVLALMLGACGGGSGGGGDGGVSAADASAPSGSTGAPAASAAPAPGPASATNNASAPNASTSPATNTVPTAMEVAPAASSSEPKIIEYYGDSTVWGYRSSSGDQVETPAPVAFAEALTHPSRYQVRNEGVSATTACDLLDGSDGKHPAWSTQMAGSDAAYVLINHAINDEWRYDVDTYKSCLTGLAQGAKQRGKTVIFETPNPTRDSGAWGLDVYVNAMKEVAAAQNVPVIDQYKHLTDYLAGASPYSICPDGLHPSEQIYIMKGKYAAAVFSSLFD